MTVNIKLEACQIWRMIGLTKTLLIDLQLIKIGAETWTNKPENQIEVKTQKEQ